MIYELRIYTMFPNQLDACNDRFANHSLQIFDRLGMKVVDFWESLEDQPKLYYTMEFDSMEHRNQLWENFSNDSEWQSIRSKSEENGRIVEKVESVFMKRSAFFKSS